jgi:YHS domain-containing protein
MSKSNIGICLAVSVALGTLAWIGCSSEPAASKTATNTAPAAKDTTVAVPEGFEQLSEADRAAALAQKICPVSGDKLGEMGTPFKVIVKGREVFLCCPSCKDDLMKDPDKYLAKLDAK